MPTPTRWEDEIISEVVLPSIWEDTPWEDDAELDPNELVSSNTNEPEEEDEPESFYLGLQNQELDYPLLAPPDQDSQEDEEYWQQVVQHVEQIEAQLPTQNGWHNPIPLDYSLEEFIDRIPEGMAEGNWQLEKALASTSESAISNYRQPNEPLMGQISYPPAQGTTPQFNDNGQFKGRFKDAMRIHCVTCKMTSCPSCSKYYLHKTISMKKQLFILPYQKQDEIIRELLDYTQHLQATLNNTKGKAILLDDATDSDNDVLPSFVRERGKEVTFEFLKVKGLSPTTKIPERRTVGAAGYDIFIDQNITIPAHERMLVSTGISLEFPDNCYARMVSRSGAVVKQGIDIGAGVIDADYRVKSAIDAEIHACMEALSALKIHYLDKEEITLRTDCHAIIKFFNKTAQNKLSRVRWISFIDYVTGTGVNIKFEHIEGTNNQLADALSRLVHYVILNLDDQNELFHVLETALEETKDAPTKIKDKLASMINSIIAAPVEEDNEGIHFFHALPVKDNYEGIHFGKSHDNVIQVDDGKELSPGEPFFLPPPY
ncbi:hypothetical protein ZIOFF_001668 [Zingiber officinale]|uniref:dUTP diphosphatase n=1 Tax=Zingiber officinale TaxID=94328 RepID=A0A8J5M7X6_ZINOF|nr:hypothetical protein ZIOFF_001668 [Zingiber officinale]